MLGSPPRMREILSLTGRRWHGSGITPAYAGNTAHESDCIAFGRDHPRVCGKYVILAHAILPCLGSPPRMREILTNTNKTYATSGITPAYAGNTLKNPNKIAIFPRLNSKNYLLFKINPLLHTILQNYNLMKETLTILSN